MERLVYKLPVFEGPLDTLLFLIARHKLNLRDIAIAELLAQYMEYVETAQRLDMNLASEFLEMASRLVQMKSAMLLPKPEKDPRGDLVGELLAYQACKQMAAALAGRRRTVFVRAPQPLEADQTYRLRHHASVLAAAFAAASGRKPPARLAPESTDFSGVVVRAAVSVTRGVLHVLRALRRGGQPFAALFARVGSRSEAVATFLAVLELVRNGRVCASSETGGVTLALSKGADNENG